MPRLRSASWLSAARRRARGSISPGSRSRRWPGCLTQRHGPRYRKTATAQPFMPAPPRSSSIAPRPPITATIAARRQSGVAQPKAWARPTGVEPPYEIFAVTADPAEGEAWTETGSDLVDVVPMPEAVSAAIDAFVAEHHVERPFYKRERDRADPEALARRGPMPKERE